MTKADQKGFSIIELVIAIVVGTSFIIGMNVITTDYLHLAPRSRNLVMANSYAEGKIEALRNIGYNGLTPGTTTVSSELPSGLPSPKSASLQITDIGGGLKRADLTLSYFDQGTTRSYSYSTYIGELGVGQ